VSDTAPAVAFAFLTVSSRTERRIRCIKRRFGAQAVTVGSFAVLLGGRDAHRMYEWPVLYDPATDSAVHLRGRWFPALDAHCVCMLGPARDLALIACGVDESGEYSMTSYLVDFCGLPTIFTVTPIERTGLDLADSAAPSPRYFAAMCTLSDSYACLCTGFHDENYFNDMWVFSLERRAWFQVPLTGQVPLPRRSASLVRVDEHTVCLFGGFDGARHFNDVHLIRFDPVYSSAHCQVVVTMGTGPSPRRRQAMVPIGDRAFLVYGGAYDPQASRRYVADVCQEFEDVFLLELDMRLVLLCSVAVVRQCVGQISAASLPSLESGRGGGGREDVDRADTGGAESAVPRVAASVGGASSAPSQEETVCHLVESYVKAEWGGFLARAILRGARRVQARELAADDEEDLLRRWLGIDGEELAHDDGIFDSPPDFHDGDEFLFDDDEFVGDAEWDENEGSDEEDPSVDDIFR
jgi:hypothetical protein